MKWFKLPVEDIPPAVEQLKIDERTVYFLLRSWAEHYGGGVVCTMSKADIKKAVGGSDKVIRRILETLIRFKLISRDGRNSPIMVARCSGSADEEARVISRAPGGARYAPEGARYAPEGARYAPEGIRPRGRTVGPQGRTVGPQGRTGMPLGAHHSLYTECRNTSVERETVHREVATETPHTDQPTQDETKIIETGRPSRRQLEAAEHLATEAIDRGQKIAFRDRWVYATAQTLTGERVDEILRDDDYRRGMERLAAEANEDHERQLEEVRKATEERERLFSLLDSWPPELRAKAEARAWELAPKVAKRGRHDVRSIFVRGALCQAIQELTA